MSVSKRERERKGESRRYGEKGRGSISTRRRVPASEMKPL